MDNGENLLLYAFSDLQIKPSINHTTTFGGNEILSIIMLFIRIRKFIICKS